MNKEVLLEVTGIHKRFEDQVVLCGADMNICSGEVHVLLGQNATGKSTLAKIIAGVTAPDEGRVIHGDMDVTGFTKAGMLRRGVYTLYQEIHLFENLTVKENVFFDVMPQYYSASAMRTAYQKLADRFGLEIDPDAQLKDIGSGEQRIVEILRAYVNDPKVLVLDEPGIYFSKLDNELFFRIINEFRSAGKGILYITHRIDDALTIADRISVMAEGRIVSTLNSKEFETEKLIRLMSGKNYKNRYPKIAAQKGMPVLQCDHVNARGIHDISFTVYEGEILGITGAVGAGKTCIGKVLSGAQRIKSGQILRYNRPVMIRKPADALGMGIGMLSERFEQNLFLNLSPEKNITITSLNNISGRLWMNSRKEKAVGEKYRKALTIHAQNMRNKIHKFNGGDKQKVALARHLFDKLDVFIIDEPTKCVDIPSKVDVYNIFNQLVEKKKSIILLTSDFSEACGMCDRILVVNRGQIVGELSRNDATEEKIISLIQKGHPAVKTANI